MTPPGPDGLSRREMSDSGTGSDWSSLCVYKRDPLARLIHDRLGIKNSWTFGWIAAGVQILDLVLLAVLASTVGSGFPWLIQQANLGNELKGNELRVVAALVYGLLVSPVAWAFYAWFNREPNLLFRELNARNLVVDVEPDADAAAFRAAERVFQSTWWTSASVIIAAGMMVFVLVTRPWRQPSLTIALPVWAVGWYMICIVTAREIAMIVSLRRFFRRGRLSVNPVHPDGCGGLGPLNRFALSFTYLLATCAFGLVLMLYLTSTGGGPFDPAILVATGLYVVLAPLCFFATLGTVHGQMKESKHGLLQDLATRLQGEYDVVSAALRAGKGPPHRQVEEIERLRTLYDLADQCPVWPFDGRSLRRFLGAVLAPLATVPVSAGATWLIQKFFHVHIS
jgi:hypothetical protein